MNELFEKGHGRIETRKCEIIPDSAIEEISMNFIQAFSPPNQVRMSIPHPCGMGLKYIGLSALGCPSGVEMLNC